MRPAISKGRGDWVVLTPKSLSPRSVLTENVERRTATSSNIEVQGLRNELKQLRQELKTLKNQRNSCLMVIINTVTLLNIKIIPHPIKFLINKTLIITKIYIKFESI